MWELVYFIELCTCKLVVMSWIGHLIAKSCITFCACNLQICVSVVSWYVCAYNFILSSRIISLFMSLTCTFSSLINVLILLCVIFLTYMCCPWLCSDGGWLFLKCSAVGIGFNGAKTNCGIARILGVLLMNSCDTKIYIF